MSADIHRPNGKLTSSSSSNTTPSFLSTYLNWLRSSVPGSVRPSYHTLPFSSLSAPACAAAMSLVGDGRRWCSVGNVALELDEKRSEGVTVLQNVHSYFLIDQHHCVNWASSGRTCRRSVIGQHRYCRQQPVEGGVTRRRESHDSLARLVTAYPDTPIRDRLSADDTNVIVRIHRRLVLGRSLRYHTSRVRLELVAGLVLLRRHRRTCMFYRRRLHARWESGTRRGGGRVGFRLPPMLRWLITRAVGVVGAGRLRFCLALGQAGVESSSSGHAGTGDGIRRSV